MKKLIFGLIAIVSFNSFSYAQLKLEDLKNDETFKEYGKEEFLVNSRIKKEDLGAIKQSIDDNHLSVEELGKIHTYYGFENHEEYLAYLKRQDERLNKLEKDYLFSKEDKEEVRKAFDDAYFNLYTNEDYQQLLGTSGVEERSSCYTGYKRCVTSAAAYAVIEHIGCGVADLTVVIGIICHSAVLTLHMNAIEDCRDSYYDCAG